MLSEVAWVLEAMGRQGDVKHVLEKILSYETLRILGFDEVLPQVEAQGRHPRRHLSKQRHKDDPLR